MTKFNRSAKEWILPLVLILFLLEIALFPLVFGITLADRSETPAHILTYTKNNLSWDSATGIRPDGSAELNLFEDTYGATVKSEDGTKVIAPGTGAEKFVRLKNSVSGKIAFTAVLYEIKTNPALPVNAELVGTNFTDTAEYPLPEGVTEENVIRAVKGNVTGGNIQDFDVNWKWEYTGNDSVDTELGNKSITDSVKLGLYIVVEDSNSYGGGGGGGKPPKPPVTPPDNPPDDPSGGGIKFTIRGSVKRNKQPVPDVDVELYSTPRKTRTNEEGKFEYKNVEGGKHKLVVIEKGKQVGLVDFFIKIGEERNVELQPDGSYLIEVPVALAEFDFDFILEDDDDGKIVYPPEDTPKPDDPPKPDDTTPDDKTPDDTTKPTDPEFTVTGIVTKDGEPVPGLPVTISGNDTPTYTDEEGRFIFTEVPKGEYTVEVKENGETAASVDFILDVGTELNITLQPDGTYLAQLTFEEPVFDMSIDLEKDKVEIITQPPVQDRVDEAPKYVYPSSPKTGDDSYKGFYIGLLILSGIVLILLLIDRKKEKKEQK